MKCLNENCLLNKKRKCGSPCQKEERFTCEGKDKAQGKQTRTTDWNRVKKEIEE